MNQNSNLRTKINQSGNSENIQNSKPNYWAHDDVHRLAMRRPSLYQKKTVPHITAHMSFSGVRHE